MRCIAILFKICSRCCDNLTNPRAHNIAVGWPCALRRVGAVAAVGGSNTLVHACAQHQHGSIVLSVSLVLDLVNQAARTANSRSISWNPMHCCRNNAHSWRWVLAHVVEIVPRLEQPGDNLDTLSSCRRLLQQKVCTIYPYLHPLLIRH